MNSEDFPTAQRILFNSDTLPGHLGELPRRDRFHEFFESAMCGAEFTFPAGRPFIMDYRFLRVDDVRIGRLQGTFRHAERDTSKIARDGDSDFFVLLNRTSSRLQASQRRREAAAAPGGAILLTHGEPLDIRVGDDAGWIGVVIPRDRLRAANAGVEDMIGLPVQRRGAVGLLASFAECLLHLDAGDLDAPLAEHAAKTIIDLLVLSLGAEQDAVAVASPRGLRMARLQEILARIQLGFADPAFSTEAIALRLGVTQRYVNKLLFDTGQTFSERVLELRLQKAWTMLADVRHAGMKVSEIAFACGFNEVSYFNRRFRARFGMSPTQCRAGKGDV